MHIKIDKNVPVPANSHRRQTKYPWNEMAVGDSIFLPGTIGVRDRLSASSRQFAKRHAGFAFVMRKEGAGYRVWRVAPKTASGKVVTPKFAGGSK
jgi:hypothetical protein